MLHILIADGFSNSEIIRIMKYDNTHNVLTWLEKIRNKTLWKRVSDKYFI